MPETLQIRLIGRGAETKRLTAELRAVAERSAGAARLITVAGDPGVGKTRLLAETRALLDGAEIGWAETSCVLHGPCHPWHPLRGLLEQMASLEPDMVAEERLLRLDALGRNLGLTGNALDGLRHLASLPTEQPDWSEGPPAERRRRLHAAITALIRAMAGEEALALVIEDLHWADPETVQWLDEFLTEQSALGALAGPPIAVIVLHRPVFSHLWPSRVPRVDLRLEPLGRRGAERLLHDVSDHWLDLTDALSQRILAQTGGNPFFIEEAVRLLRDQGSDAADAALPQTAAGLVEARLNLLDRRSKAMLQAAAVIGPEIRTDLLEHLCCDAEWFERDLQTLLSAEMLVPRETVRGCVLRFRHSIIQKVTHASILQAQRRELHGSLALHLEALHGDHPEDSAELLAHHFGQSNHHARAAHHLRLAAERAKRLCSHGSAERHLARLAETVRDHGHAIGDAEDLAAWTALERGRLARLSGDMERACSLLAEAAPTASAAPSALSIQLLRAWAETERQRGEAERASALLERALAACDAMKGDGRTKEAEQERMLTLLALGVAQRVRGEMAEAMGPLSEAERLARLNGEIATVASALNNQGICWLTSGDFQRAHSPLREAVDLLRALGDQRNLAGALINLGIAFDRLLALDRALDAYAEALRLAYELGHRRAILANHLNAGQALQWLDNQGEASRHFRRVLEHCGRWPDAVAEGLAHLNLGFSHLHRGALDECGASLAEAERRAESTGDHTLRVHCALLRAEHTLRAGDADEAERAARCACELVAEGEERPWALRLLGCAALARGKGEGMGTLRESLWLARVRRDAREQIRTLIAMAAAAREGGRPLASRRHWRRAERLLTRHPIPLLQRNLREALP